MSKTKRNPWNPFPLAALKVEGLTACAKTVLIYLAARSGHKGETCVGHRTMRRELVRSADFITKGLKELAAKGLIKEANRNRSAGEAMWRTIDRSILPSRTKVSPEIEGHQSCLAGVISPEEQDYVSPAQQSETLQISTTPFNLADSNPSNLADENNNNRVDVVPQTVAGFTLETVQAHVAKFPEGSWVWKHATKDALTREGFVKHIMSLEPPKKALRMGADGTPLPQYRQESGQRSIFGKGDI